MSSLRGSRRSGVVQNAISEVYRYGPTISARAEVPRTQGQIMPSSATAHDRIHPRACLRGVGVWVDFSHDRPVGVSPTHAQTDGDVSAPSKIATAAAPTSLPAVSARST